MCKTICIVITLQWADGLTTINFVLAIVITTLKAEDEIQIESNGEILI